MEEIKKVILVIEDEVALSRALGMKLASEGFHILSARNGKDGLELAIDKKPDLILLDIMMPIMNGITMLEKLREDAWGKSAQVIVLTNIGADSSTLADVMEKDVTEYLVKNDMSLEQITEKIKERV